MVSYLALRQVSMGAAASLNPCCNGRWSRTLALRQVSMGAAAVLILVVMEDGLVHGDRFDTQILSIEVLILVVMEDGLVRQSHRYQIYIH